MTRFVLSICALMVAFVASAHADISKANKAAFEEMIRAYIMDNPDVIRQSLIELQEREQLAAMQRGLDLARAEQPDGVMGNPNGDLIIYEFSDYNCGYCRRMFSTLQAVVEEDPNLTVKVKELPILAESSVLAARAGIAAQKQGKFEAFHSAMMQSAGGISNATIEAAALEANMDLDQMLRDMDTAETEETISRTRAAATALEVRGTPALLIGDTLLPGAVDINQLRSVIEAERSKKNS